MTNYVVLKIIWPASDLHILNHIHYHKDFEPRSEDQYCFSGNPTLFGLTKRFMITQDNQNLKLY